MNRLASVAALFGVLAASTGCRTDQEVVQDEQKCTQSATQQFSDNGFRIVGLQYHNSSVTDDYRYTLSKTKDDGSRVTGSFSCFSGGNAPLISYTPLIAGGSPNP